MAFNLSQNLASTLRARENIDSGSLNPNNLENQNIERGHEVNENLLRFNDVESADVEVDRLTTIAETYVQSTRVVVAETHVIESQNEFDKARNKLFKACAKGQITRDKMIVQLQTLVHKLNVNQRKLALGYAADVQETNLAFAKFERDRKLKLHAMTDMSRGGLMPSSRGLFGNPYRSNNVQVLN